MALSQTQDVDETWRMVREDGKWKWCGQAISRNFTSGDLARMVLQPNEVPLPFTNYGDTVDTALGLWPKEYCDQFQPYSPQAGHRKSYEQERIGIDSIAVLFKSSADARQGFQVLSKIVKETSYKNAKSINADGLGDESFGLSGALQSENWVTYEYVWRVNNVLLALLI